MTKIEWAAVPNGDGGFKKGETWNAQVGCRELSPACRACYAAKLAHRGMSEQHRGLTVLRKDGPHWNGEIKRVPHLLSQPLKWREPRGVFVGSMTDLFFDVESHGACEYIAAIFGVMAATPRHTYMLLTKRPENAAKWFAWLEKRPQVEPGPPSLVHDLLHDAWAMLTGKPECRHVVNAVAAYRRGEGPPWPLPNCWLGVTAEDQQRADERIPVLLELPATVHYASYEPACGAVNFRRVPVPASMAAPRDFATVYNAVAGAECASDGTVIARGPRLDQIIAGGESGPGARPSHPDWFRSARDQCVDAGVAFFFKQWGEFSPVGEQASDSAQPAADTWSHMVGLEGKSYRSGEEMPMSFASEIGAGRVAFMRKVGKKNAGRELDGRTWDEFPARSHKAVDTQPHP